MRYYEFNIGDYAADTVGLSPIEDLAYRRMIDMYYLSEQPLNGCSTDVARCCGLRDYVAEVEYVLQRFFDLADGKYIHKRIEKDLERFRERVEKKRKAGRASAEARKIKGSNEEEQADSTPDQQVFNNCSTTHLPIYPSTHLPSEEQSTLSEGADPPAEPDGRPPSCPTKQIIELYNSICTHLPVARRVTDATKAVIGARWREDEKHQSLEFWKFFFKYVNDNPFLSGRKEGRSFRASLEWVVKASNFAKIVNGNYDDSAQNAAA